MTTSGVLTNEFATSGPASEPSGITSGPDKALWFTENVGNNIGRIATSTRVVVAGGRRRRRHHRRRL